MEQVIDDLKGSCHRQDNLKEVCLKLAKRSLKKTIGKESAIGDRKEIYHIRREETIGHRQRERKSVIDML